MATVEQNSDVKSAAPEIAFLNGQPMVRISRSNGRGKGRPKGAKNRKTIVREIANEMHIVHEGGVRQKRTTLELVLLRLRNLALGGKKTRAFDELQKLIKKYEPQAVDDNVGFLLVPPPLSPEEFDEMRKKNPPIHPKERRRLKAEKTEAD